MDLPSLLFYFMYLLAFYQVAAQDEINSPRSRSCKSIFNELPATCISLKKCEPFMKLIKDNPASARLVISVSQCPTNHRHHHPIVCCPNQESEPTNDKPNEQESNTTPEPTTTSSRYEPLQPPQCGYSNTVHDRVVGGNPSVLGAWPWIALIGYYKTSNTVSFRCGGTLISSRHVVTAGHCVKGDKPRLVRLGEHDVANQNDGSQPIDIYVDKVILHPNFNSVTLENDIAILRLNKDVKFTDAIHPICLPINGDIQNRSLVGTYPFVAGWGTTAFQGSASSILREAQLPVVDNAQCKKAYKNVANTVVDDRIICAGYAQGGKDACQGDSGGPLMFPTKMTYYLIGVVSGGYRCAEAGYPGLYTRVTYFLDFILSKMK